MRRANDLEWKKRVKGLIADRMIDLRTLGKSTPKNAMKRKDLVADLKAVNPGLKLNEVEWRNLYSELAKDGRPFCSTTDGYFYAIHPDEMDHPIAFLLSYARDMEERARGLTKAQEQMMPAGPMTLFDKGEQ